MKARARYFQGGTLLLLFLLTLSIPHSSFADIHYVWTNSPNASPPYTNWQTAAHVIQDAIDAASSGDTVLVTNGVYETGGRVVAGQTTNRVVITAGITVQSVNGPAATVIKGSGPLGETAVRCVYVGTHAVLSGFTLTNGATRASGYYDIEHSGGGVWCENSAVISNCTLTGNSAEYGGGSYGGTLNNCTLTENSALDGGGSYYGTLNNCTLTGNSAEYGGGSSGGTLNNCTLTGNSAQSNGGGSYEGTLNNCTLTGNSAGYGGGSLSCTLNNCTLTGNSAQFGGGSYYGTLNNCIVYYNLAHYSGDNYYRSTLTYSCTTPDPGGIGNITSEPVLASASHLSMGSPCRGMGSRAYVSGRDIDGEAWLDPPSMGCDEWVAGSATGVLPVSVFAAYTDVAAGSSVDFWADIGGHPTESLWLWGDGESTANRPYASHAFMSNGVYQVRLVVYNDSYPGGVTGTVTVTVVERMIRYVDITNAFPVSPYDSWATAATNIQDAIDAATQIGALVLVNDGVYDTGGRVVVGRGEMTNRVVISEGLTVRSVNGPEATVIRGSGPPGETAVRCVYVGTHAVLSGFTLTNGATRTSGDAYTERSGGGVWCESSAVISNCRLTGNLAGYYGGGAYVGTLNNCTLTGNSAQNDGGGSYDGTLNNCTLTENSAENGGGAYEGTLNNCTLTGNLAQDRGGGSSGGTLNNCTLTGNSAQYDGGGSSDGTLNNCTLTGNSAQYDGGGSYDGALNNCTLTRNSAQNDGGGSYGGTLNNCTLTGNSAQNDGGGSSYGTLNNCTLTGNSAQNDGGGAYEGTLNNCTLTENSGLGGGGSSYGTLNNCIVYYNSANSSDNYYLGTLTHTCTIPDPGGTGNITNAPVFADRTNGDYTLEPTSPCIDAGQFDDWMQEATDIAGRSRAMGGGVDMGAHEFRFEAALSGFISGAYAATSGLMRSVLPLPSTAPYAADVETAETLPTNAVDWVLLELRPAIDSNPSLSVSAILREDGRIVMPDGGETVYLEGKGCNHLVLRHRNHLAVITPDLVTTNAIFSYNFTTGTDKYYGGTNACIQISSNQWGMIPGDADADGRITEVDRQIVLQSIGKDGYLQADLNLDGLVTTNDLGVTKTGP